MRIGLPRGKDFWAGLLFVGFGAFALRIGYGYTVGVAHKMGPGYFPVMLGWILCGIGVIVAVRGLLAEGAAIERGVLRPFLVLLGVLAFALLLEPAGLVVATVVLITVSSLGGFEVRIGEVAAVTVALTLAGILIFAWGLGLQIPIWPAR